MITASIKDKNLFIIIEENAEQPLYGSNQEWYLKKWQRMSGCGPSTVTNIIYYLNRTRNNSQCCTNLTKNDCLNLMNEIWNFVTPSFGGISSTNMLCKGVKKYLTENALNIQMDFIDVPKKNSLRPDFKDVLTFINKALEDDTPVAFLNLDHGTVLELDSWHWVTIIGLTYEADGSTAFVDIMDGGLLIQINLSQWYQTTKLGGGFVSFAL
jgi:hypothetical protein